MKMKETSLHCVLSAALLFFSGAVYSADAAEPLATKRAAAKLETAKLRAAGIDVPAEPMMNADGTTVYPPGTVPSVSPEVRAIFCASKGLEDVTDQGVVVVGPDVESPILCGKEMDDRQLSAFLKKNRVSGKEEMIGAQGIIQQFPRIEVVEPPDWTAIVNENTHGGGRIVFTNWRLQPSVAEASFPGETIEGVPDRRCMTRQTKIITASHYVAEPHITCLMKEVGLATFQLAGCVGAFDPSVNPDSCTISHTRVTVTWPMP